MQILLLGSGGREHALAWKITQSAHCDHLYIAPGNPGTAGLGTNVSVAVDDIEGIRKLAIELKIDLLVVGPEVPLVKGISDVFAGDPKLFDTIVIGPKALGARLEGSKAFAKSFMREFNIPTASYRAFDKSELKQGLDYLSSHEMPVVLKADGLAAGKGVLICEDLQQASNEMRNMLENAKFGNASDKVVVESFLKGIELSVFVLTNGHQYKILPTSKDYKRIGEADTGLNTGGMGAVSPVPFADAAFMKTVEQKVIRPTIDGLKARGIDYCGFLYFGLIKIKDEPWVIEYNCRLGDPETQAVLPLIESDLVDLLTACGRGKLDDFEVKTKSGAAATVVMTAPGYPGSYPKGMPIRGLNEEQTCLVFQAGTRQGNNGQLLTSGGRVLAVSALGSNFKEALQQSYQAIENIQFEGAYHRRDIGFDL